MKKLETSSIADETVKWRSPFGHVWQFLKMSNRVTLWSSNISPRYKSQRIGNTFYKNLYTNVPSSIIHNSQKVETTQMLLTGEWINKMWFICTMEYYLAIKNYLHYNIDKASKHYAKWKKPGTKGFSFTNMWFHLCRMFGAGKPTDMEHRWSGCLRLAVEEMGRESWWGWAFGDTITPLST